MHHEFHLPGEASTSRLFLNPFCDSQTLVVLCHGWHGHLTKTWGDLVGLFRRHIADHTPLFGKDLLFLGYSQSPASLDLLSSWLEQRIRTFFPRLRLESDGIAFERVYR